MTLSPQAGFLQVVRQRSGIVPLLRAPASHSSPVSVTLSPQRGSSQVKRQTSGSESLRESPVSHCSPLSRTESPHRGSAQFVRHMSGSAVLFSAPKSHSSGSSLRPSPQTLGSSMRQAASQPSPSALCAVQFPPAILHWSAACGVVQRRPLLDPPLQVPPKSHCSPSEGSKVAFPHGRSSSWQVNEQPSPLCVFLSSHCSPASLSPLPQTLSKAHRAEHPSPLIVFPSSQLSVPSGIPLPQRGSRRHTLEH